MKTTKFLLSVFLVCIVFFSCTEKNQNEQTPKSAPPEVILKGDDIVLSRVNGSPITQFELELAIRKTLGKYASGKLGDAGRKKVLESLVASRAMAQAQEPSLSQEDKALMTKKVKAYREELLVMRYLADNAPPEPVTQEMVMEYYNKHPERFGGKTIRRYEMISSERDLPTDKRDALINALSGPEDKKDWKKWAKELKAKDHPLAYRQGRVDEKILDKELRDLMRPLKKGEASKLSFIKGAMYVVRIVDEEVIEPRPLSEVSAQIRKSLVPVQLKKSVKMGAEEVLKNAEVVYINN